MDQALSKTSIAITSPFFSIQIFVSYSYRLSYDTVNKCPNTVDNTMDFENKSLFGPVKQGCVSSPKYPAKSNGRRI